MKTERLILIIDDTPTGVAAIKQLLLRTMPEVHFLCATGRDDFLGYLERLLPDVILSNHAVSGFTAAEALSVLQERSAHIPFILVTESVSKTFAAEMIWRGADDYLLKNDLQRLPAAIEDAITRRYAERAKQRDLRVLQQSEDRYRALIERVTDAFIALDRNWCFTYVNVQAGLLGRKEPSSLIGKYIWDEFPAAVGSITYHAFNRAMEEQVYVSNFDYYAPLNLWHENHIYPSTDGLSVFVKDVTIRKKAEDEILQKNAELRKLSSHLRNIREEERIRIAREIHDDLGQQLTGLKMDMHWLGQRLMHADVAIREKPLSAITLIDETVRSVRRIASDLRPSILDDLGLVAALEWHGQEVEKRSGIKVHFSAHEQDLHVPQETATDIFRIYQEVLTNVVRHAKAQKVNATLKISGDFLQLDIRDDGRGFESSAAKTGKTLGLLGIKERTYILGGSVEFSSEIGKGTEVRISVPYPGNH